MSRLPLTHRPAPEIAKRIYAERGSARKAQDKKRTGNRLALSQIGKCERMLWALHHLEAKRIEMEPRMLELMELGNTIETHLDQVLESIGMKVVNQQARIVILDGEASGRIDGEIEIGSRTETRRVILWEAKSSNKRRFEELVEMDSFQAWNSDYYDQTQIYMGERRRGECLVTVYCKDDSRIWSCYLRFDEPRHKELVKKAERVVRGGELPAQPKEAKSKSCAYCRWCDINKWCWGPMSGVKFDA